MKLTKEELERILETHPDNSFEHAHRAERLLNQAKAGNEPWHILETEYGFVGDYNEWDSGNPPN